MPNEPTVTDLQQRITELELQVADLQAQLREAAGHPHPEATEDAEWGEFNPG
jgi:uncharacterized protein involved in exopolysaccharide biosynthesis